MIKNIIFDIGGVLVDFHPVLTLQEMGLSKEAVEVISKNTACGSRWQELDRGVIPREEVFNSMLADIPQEYKADASRFLHDEALKTVTAFDYAGGWVESLKKRNLNIYLLTNYPDWMFDYHFEHEFTFAKYVDGMIVSGKEKVIKPDPKIYELILAKYNLKPQECVFIDDRLENVQAAQKLGINAIQFTKLDEVKQALEKLL